MFWGNQCRCACLYAWVQERSGHWRSWVRERGRWAGVSVYTGAQLQPAVQPANYMVRLIQREKSSHFFTF